MATPKYKKQVETMLVENKALFDDYIKLEEAYKKSPKKHAEELREMKFKLLRILRKNEDRLCARTENTHYSSYSENLAMLFWQEVRMLFPDIEKVVE